MKHFPNYDIDRNGNVSRNGKRLRQHLNSCGYKTVNLCVKGQNRSQLVHRLLAIEFIPNPLSKPTVNHRNGKRGDNRLINLEWMTRKEQARHSVDVLKTPHDWSKGALNPNAKLNERNVDTIRKKLALGVPVASIARQFDVASQTIYLIKKGKTWL